MLHVVQTPIGYYDDGSPGLSRDDVAADHTCAIRVPPKQSPDAMMHSSHATMLLRFAAIGILVAPAGQPDEGGEK